LVDYAPHFESVCLVVPAAGVPQAATGAEAESFYRNTARAGEVHAVADFCNPDEEYPYATPISFAEFIKRVESELGRKIARVGVIEEIWIPEWLLRIWRGVAGAGSGALISFDKRWYGLKAIKSPAEIDVMKYAYQLAEAGLEAGVGAIASGVSEREVAAEIEYVMRKRGSEGAGIDTIVGSGVGNTQPILTRATPRKIVAGELVLLTIAPRYEGYHAAIGRPFMVEGQASAQMKHASEVAIEAGQAIVSKLRAGAVAKDVVAAGLDVFRREGLIEHCVYSGNHTIGTAEFEPPILTSDSDLVLQENMIFSVDVPVFFTEWGGLRYEDGYLITASGPERLNATPTNPL
jgi:Xaa-Pro aminopeptidase